MVHDVAGLLDAPAWLAAAIALAATGALVALVVLAWRRAYRSVRLAIADERRARTEAAPFVDDAEVVLCGTVRHAEGYDVAVKVSVTQVGEERQPGDSTTWHRWTEVERIAEIAPFVLELADGRTVLVEPDASIAVVDALDQLEHVGRTRRIRSAELVPGERLSVRGRLARSDRAVDGVLRDVEWGWTLRAPARGRMVMSSEPLGWRHRAAAGLHRRHAIVAVVALGIAQAILLPFYDRIDGRAQVDRVESRVDDGTADACDAFLLADAGTACVHEPDYHAIAIGTPVHTRHGALAPSVNWSLGRDPTLTWFHLIALGFLAAWPWVRYARGLRAARPWYRGRVDERGDGSLPAPQIPEVDPA